MSYVYQYDVAALFIAVIIFVTFFFKTKIVTRISKAFSFLVLDLIVSCVTDLITAYTIKNPFSVPLGLNYFLNTLYYISFNALPMFYYNCVLVFTVGDRPLRLDQKIRVWALFVASAVIIASSFVTRWVFFFDENRIYSHGNLFNLLMIFGFLELAFVIIRTIRKRRQLSRMQISTTVVFTVGIVGAVIIQKIYTSLLVTLFVSSIAVLLVYLSLDNPTDYMDSLMDIFNKKAFMTIVQDKLSKEKRFNVIGIQIVGINYLNETIGYSNFNALLRQLGEFLASTGGKKNSFRLSGSKLAIVCDSEKKAKEIIQQIQQKFAVPFEVLNLTVSLSYKITLLRCPDESDNIESVVDLIFYTLDTSDSNEGKVIEANRHILEKNRREERLIGILKEAIVSEGFEVFYQPIYSIKKNKFTTAEALIRLKSTELGFISPEEFIPLAEKNGLIIEIGEFVFRSVCRTISEERLWQKGIEYVHVNLSVIQCMQDSLHNQLKNIMDEFAIPYKFIHLEVTETAAVISSEILKFNMSKLIENDINFALDDYGMGFSNTASLINYPFHTIKLDKSMVWAAMQDSKAKIILENTISMVKALHMEVVAEGVETEVQARELIEMGCDYFQGYLFSKPVSRKEFVELIDFQKDYAKLYSL